ncbi:hypothetical protein [Halomonas sp. Cn5-12]|uniref:hypothetical protein n=1 Tax=Halomonas sp. Cn5-12 TaxID=2908885 RepID=UPI001F2D9AB5|nr:hypothetical protein [Halomonas sp. Cn5-12]MCF2911884.1 hypothetical protein [Halomonas sp. Cn5-12]
MYTDKKGHVYESDADLDSAILWLEQDAAYLRAQVEKYNDRAVKQAVADNAKHSAEYADHLRSLRPTVK